MVAGFLYGYLTTGSYEEAFRYGICTGSASAFSEALATREEVEGLVKRLGTGEGDRGRRLAYDIRRYTV